MNFTVSNQENFQTNSSIHNINTRNKHHPIVFVTYLWIHGMYVCMYVFIYCHVHKVRNCTLSSASFIPTKLASSKPTVLLHSHLFLDPLSGLFHPCSTKVANASLPSPCCVSCRTQKRQYRCSTFQQLNAAFACSCLLYRSNYGCGFHRRTDPPARSAKCHANNYNTAVTIATRPDTRSRHATVYLPLNSFPARKKISTSSVTPRLRTINFYQ